MPVYKLENYGFKQYTAKDIAQIEDFKLQPGDLLCTTGHVEFYKGEGNSNSLGWGDVHSSYKHNPGIIFTVNTDGSFSEPKRGKKEERRYTVIYRYEGIK